MNPIAILQEMSTRYREMLGGIIFEEQIVVTVARDRSTSATLALAEYAQYSMLSTLASPEPEGLGPSSPKRLGSAPPVDDDPLPVLENEEDLALAQTKDLVRHLEEDDVAYAIAWVSEEGVIGRISESHNVIWGGQTTLQAAGMIKLVVHSFLKTCRPDLSSPLEPLALESLVGPYYQALHKKIRKIDEAHKRG